MCDPGSFMQRNFLQQGDAAHCCFKARACVCHMQQQSHVVVSTYLAFLLCRLVLHRYMHAQGSLVMLGRQNIVEQVSIR